MLGQELLFYGSISGNWLSWGRRGDCCWLTFECLPWWQITVLSAFYTWSHLIFTTAIIPLSRWGSPLVKFSNLPKIKLPQSGSGPCTARMRTQAHRPSGQAGLALSLTITVNSPATDPVRSVRSWGNLKPILRHNCTSLSALRMSCPNPSFYRILLKKWCFHKFTFVNFEATNHNVE